MSETSGVLEPMRALARRVTTAVREEPAHTLTLKLALVVTLLYGTSWSTAEVPVRILATAMLVFPSLLTQPALWWLLTTALAVGNARAWDIIDNHEYLVTYWVLACTLSLHVRRRERWLSTVARALTALVFGFAVLWKIVGGQFVTGSVVYYTLLTDARLTNLSALVTGTPLNDLLLIPRAIEFLGGQGAAGTPIMLPNAPSLFVVAVALSWLALVVEGGVAAVHVGGGKRWYSLRHFSLMMFVVLSYFLLPLAGFASVLLLLGLAQCREDDSRMRMRYLLMLGVMQLTLMT